jgi:hypothetical protein
MLLVELPLFARDLTEHKLKVPVSLHSCRLLFLPVSLLSCAFFFFWNPFFPVALYFFRYSFFPVAFYFFRYSFFLVHFFRYPSLPLPSLTYGTRSILVAVSNSVWLPYFIFLLPSTGISHFLKEYPPIMSYIRGAYTVKKVSDFLAPSMEVTNQTLPAVNN